jgi:hypothetical protein
MMKNDQVKKKTFIIIISSLVLLSNDQFLRCSKLFIIITDIVMKEEVDVLDKSPVEQLGSDFYILIV